MNRLGDEFLSGSALTPNQYRGLARCHPSHQGKDFEHPTALANDALDTVVHLECFSKLAIL